MDPRFRGDDERGGRFRGDDESGGRFRGDDERGGRFRGDDERGGRFRGDDERWGAFAEMTSERCRGRDYCFAKSWTLPELMVIDVGVTVASTIDPSLL